MKKLMVLAAGAAAVLALGSTAFAQDAQPSPQSAPAAQAAPAGAAGKGHIIFFRPSRLSGAFYTYHVVETGDDGKQHKDSPVIGDLSNGAAFAVDIEAGIHDYNITGPMAVNKADDRLRLEVEPGETYYVEQQLRIGLITGGFRLVPADEARFTQSHTKLKQ